MSSWLASIKQPLNLKALNNFHLTQTRCVMFDLDGTLVDSAPDITKNWLEWGAGPRASTFLIMAAQAKCLLSGKSTPDIDDIKDVSKPVLRHRIITNFTAEADGVSKEDILDQLIDKMKI